MFTRYVVYTLVIGGLIFSCSLLVFVSAHCQTQPQAASPPDTVSKTGENEEQPTVTREKIEYKSKGKKDPFLPLFEEKEEEELPLLQVEGATLVGIMVGPKERLALVQDAEQRTYVLREGARVKNGSLRRIRTDGAIFSVAKYGRYRKVELELKSEKRAECFEKGILEATPQPRPVIQKPPAQPTKKVEVSDKVPGVSKFTLQVAAFRREDDAKRLQRWLQERGYGTRIEAVNIPGSGLWYRVRFGMYKTYDGVKEMAETFRRRFNFYCWIVPIDS